MRAPSPAAPTVDEQRSQSSSRDSASTDRLSPVSTRARSRRRAAPRRAPRAPQLSGRRRPAARPPDSAGDRFEVASSGRHVVSPSRPPGRHDPGELARGRLVRPARRSTPNAEETTSNDARSYGSRSTSPTSNRRPGPRCPASRRARSSSRSDEILAPVTSAPARAATQRRRAGPRARRRASAPRAAARAPSTRRVVHRRQPLARAARSRPPPHIAPTARTFSSSSSLLARASRSAVSSFRASHSSG